MLRQSSRIAADDSSVLRQSSRKKRAAELRADESSDAEDDGRVIADMSALDGVGPAIKTEFGSGRDVREELGDPDDRRALIFGATWAGLSIGLVYIIVFGVVIALLLWLWR